MLHRTLCSLGLALALIAAAIVPAQAQADYGQAKLDSFVTAAVAVNDLIDKWTPRIQGAESEQQANQLRTQANEEMVAAIEETDGITVDEYQEILDTARNDQEFSARIQEMFQARAEQQ